MSEIDKGALEAMRGRKHLGTWHAYRNEAMDSSNPGHMTFLVVGPECTHKEPPKHAPDGWYGLGWKYLHVGPVDLDTGEIKEKDRGNADGIVLP